MSEPTQDVTGLLEAWQRGDRMAMSRLLPLVYEELRRVARARLRAERDAHTLQATALVHEAYMRLVGSGRPAARTRVQFFAIAARLMRQILVDQARRRRARKRGGGDPAISLAEAAVVPALDLVDLLALDQALADLTAIDPRLCQVVELRFFAGLSIDDTAEALQVSTATVERDWAVAKAWLYERLRSGRSAIV